MPNNQQISPPKLETIKAISEAVVAFRDARDWKQFHTAKDMALSLMLEAGEVGELFQWKTENELSNLCQDHSFKKELGCELSDVMYWVTLIAHDSGIDLSQAFADKLIENGAKYPVATAKGSSAKYDRQPSDGDNS